MRTLSPFILRLTLEVDREPQGLGDRPLLRMGTRRLLVRVAVHGHQLRKSHHQKAAKIPVMGMPSKRYPGLKSAAPAS